MIMIWAVDLKNCQLALVIAMISILLFSVIIFISQSTLLNPGPDLGTQERARFVFNPGPDLPIRERLRFIEKVSFCKGMANDSDRITATVRNDDSIGFKITSGYVTVLENYVERNLTIISEVFTVPANSTTKVSILLPAGSLVEGDYYLITLNTKDTNLQNSTELIKYYRVYESTGTP